MSPNSVLIIEDDSALLRGLRDNFHSQGYEVRTAADGRIGLAEALEFPPDLIVLDIMLPLLNGYEICRQLRSRKLDPVIIMLTAKGQEEEIVRGLEVGADDYVTKPFSILELLARAKAFLRRRGIPQVQRLIFGDCDLDLQSHKLTRSGREIPLTRKEYKMLEFFAQRPNRALTRNEILDNVWGRSIIVTSRSIDRCITTLRGKIEPEPRNPIFIHTIRDIGYRFELPQ